MGDDGIRMSEAARLIDDLIGTGEAARIVGVSVSWIRRLAIGGEIPCVRMELGVRLFSRDEIRQFAEERERKKPSPEEIKEQLRLRAAHARTAKIRHPVT